MNELNSIENAMEFFCSEIVGSINRINSVVAEEEISVSAVCILIPEILHCITMISNLIDFIQHLVYELVPLRVYDKPLLLLPQIADSNKNPGT